VKRWFIIDIVASFPFNLIASSLEQKAVGTAGYNKILRLLRLPRLYRILKITRLIKILSVMERNHIMVKM
jgi:hypothetical protein